MIAVLNSKPRKCPETGALCESARCGIEMCQRLKERQLTEAAFPGKAGARPTATTPRQGRTCPVTDNYCVNAKCTGDSCTIAPPVTAKCPVKGGDDCHQWKCYNNHRCVSSQQPLCHAGAGGKCWTPSTCFSEKGHFLKCRVAEDRQKAKGIVEKVLGPPKPKVWVRAPVVYRCKLDDEPCDNDKTERCAECTAPLPETAPPKRGLVPDSNGLLRCPALKAPCALKDCVESGVCSLDFSVKPKPTRTCPRDSNLCDSKWCNDSNQCAIEVAYKDTPAKGNTTTMPTTPVKYSGGYAQCHTGVYKMGTIGHATIWAGREAAISRVCPGTHKSYALIICLIEGSSREPEWLHEGGVVSGNAAANKLIPGSVFRRTEAVPFLHVQWPDFGVPPLNVDWWKSFVTALARVRGDVALYCQGGHGRTGTALSILACMADWVRKDQCPVTWVRTNYCTHCVESESQARYIEDMTGWTVFAHGSKGGAAIDGYSFPAKGAQGQIRAAGSATPGGKKKGQKAEGRTPQKLSKNFFKKWVKQQRRKGVQIPTIGELDDMEMITIDSEVFRWNKPDQKFEFVGLYNPEPEADLPPETPEADPVG